MCVCVSLLVGLHVVEVLRGEKGKCTCGPVTEWWPRRLDSEAVDFQLPEEVVVWPLTPDLKLCLDIEHLFPVYPHDS